MQAASEAIQSVVGQKGDKPGPFERGYQPEPKEEKAAQGGDDSRPPGKQWTMKGAPRLSTLAAR